VRQRKPSGLREVRLCRASQCGIKMNQPNNTIPGLAARQSAIRLLDAVCRRGETLDQAMPAATGKLSNPSDKALAHRRSSSSRPFAITRPASVRL